MNVYMYQAALYCEHCGEEIRQRLMADGKAPANPEDEYTYYSDDFPKGPYPDGGGEADCPQHCDSCHCFLENEATPDGRNYIKESILDNLCSGDGDDEVIQIWREFYTECEPSREEIMHELLRIALPEVKRHEHPSSKRLRWIKTCEQVLEEEP